MTCHLSSVALFPSNPMPSGVGMSARNVAVTGAALSYRFPMNSIAILYRGAPDAGLKPAARRIGYRMASCVLVCIHLMRDFAPCQSAVGDPGIRTRCGAFDKLARYRKIDRRIQQRA